MRVTRFVLSNVARLAVIEVALRWLLLEALLGRDHSRTSGDAGVCQDWGYDENAAMDESDHRGGAARK